MVDGAWSMYANVSLAPDIMQRTYAGSTAPYHSGVLFDPRTPLYNPIGSLLIGNMDTYLKNSFSPDSSVPGKSNIKGLGYDAVHFGPREFVPVKESILDKLK